MFLNKLNNYLFVFLFKGEFLLFDNLQLVTEVEFGGLLLEFGEFVLVFGYLLECRFEAREIIIKNLKADNKIGGLIAECNFCDLRCVRM